MKKLQKAHNWTAADDELLKQLYLTSPASAVAKQMNLTQSQIKNRVQRLGILKFDNCGRFSAHQTPWNKGTHFHSGGRSIETQFKKGERTGRANALYQPIGTTRLSKDGYIEVKTNDDLPMQKRWRAAHIITWEKANGPVPASCAITFKDKNKLNTSLENLELKTRADLMRQNSLHNYGPEIASIYHLQGVIQRQINLRSKK